MNALTGKTPPKAPDWVCGAEDPARFHLRSGLGLPENLIYPNLMVMDVD